MHEFPDRFGEFQDKEYRESYAADYLHSFIAMQFRVVREQRGMTQQQLADAIETKQTAISRLENINNKSRNLTLLQKAAFALGCRLRVSLETYGSLVNDEGPNFSRQMLQRPSFEDDPLFKTSAHSRKMASGNLISFPTSHLGQPATERDKQQGADSPFQLLLTFGSENAAKQQQPRPSLPYSRQAA